MSDEELLDLAQSLQHHANQAYFKAAQALRKAEEQVVACRAAEESALTARNRADALVEALYARVHKKEK